jgi:radical SAM protein with 4Fe4S-binding SPASM domain
VTGAGPSCPGASGPAWTDPPSVLSRTERTRVPSPDTPVQRITMEFSRRCNLRCVYCYAESGPDVNTGLTEDEVRSVIREAVECGAALISFVSGGEPLLRPSVLEDGRSCIEYANSLGCYCLLYTNCTLLDANAARWLSRRDVTVVGKLNSLKHDVQDELAGVPGSAVQIRRGIENLLDAGFAKDGAYRLALETIICRQNYDEMPDIWRWMRDRGVVPEVEIPTVHGRFEKNQDRLYFSEDEARHKYQELFDELLRIDQTEYGFDWVPHPPFPGSSCRLLYSNCYINDRGGVQPCAGIDREYGRLRLNGHGAGGRPLADIIMGEEYQKLRQIHLHVKAPCAGCDLLGQCYGCRGAAWHATGDVFAGDPVCWRRS